MIVFAIDYLFIDRWNVSEQKQDKKIKLDLRLMN